jgi:precorrin-6A/cobalt-precorrin-6A reductase
MISPAILILGGTREAAALAAKLVGERPDARIISSLAGRTREPRPVAGEVRTGGFGGLDGLVDYLRNEGITQIIDATHPFALQISRNARMAARATGIPLDIRSRPPWLRQPGDNWIEVTSIDAAIEAIPAKARVLLALGSQHIAPFARRVDVHFVVRMIDPPDQPLPLPDHALLIGLPAQTVDQELAILHKHAMTHLICRNSGGSSAYAKIGAARLACLPVIIIQRPRADV